MTDKTQAAMKTELLGPFLGHVTDSSIKIWLHMEGPLTEAFVTVHPQDADKPRVAAAAKFTFSADRLWSDCVMIEGLKPDTRYVYRLWTNSAYSIPLDLQGLDRRYLYFHTLPSDPRQRVDFVVMSCHNPFESMDDGYQGHAIWADMLQIIGHENNKYVRFAVLGGDQMYSDSFKERLLAEADDNARDRIYVEAYRKFWGNILYRRVMASLPAVMIWDDHEIMDGWGSEQSSFEGETNQFKEDWGRMFRSASRAFERMQAIRNPDRLSQTDGFDVAFRFGGIGVLLLDLRTHRNYRLRQVVTEEQMTRIRKWLQDNKNYLNTLFVVSPVVFSHGPHVVEQFATQYWQWVLWAFQGIARLTPWGKGMYRRFDQSVGDIRDDIRDAWSSEVNAEQADMILDELFGLQNDSESDVAVVILSGDIHTSGYSNVYSADVKHAARPSIPHITCSSVSYKPFNWMLEAVYRHASKTVALGRKQMYHAQVSHHYCARSITVVSMRPTATGEQQMKVKYYLEGYPEPQILLFDLDKASHRENIDWIADEKIYGMETGSAVGFDVEGFLKQRDVNAILEEKARTATEQLDYKESIVDLLKLLGQDSGLGARKKLARQLGYEGDFGDTFAMNVWLHQQVMRRFIEEQSSTTPKEKTGGTR